MPAADDDGARRRCTGWLDRLLVARAEESERTAARPQDENARQKQDAALLDALVSGLPDPVVVLDHEGRVVAFNSGAVTIAPALRRGGPASIALRLPDLVGAIRNAIDTGKPQRIEFSERAPADRWFEAVVAPVSLSGEPRRADLLCITFHDLTPLRRVEE